MTSRHRVSRTAIDLLKRFEGYRRHAVALPDGRWTLGHGHTLTAREGAEVSAEDAEALLIYDLIAVAHVLNETIYAPLTQNQFDALTSFAFNIGLENFRGSDVLRRLNEEWGVAVLLAEHRLERCLAAADRVVAMASGSISFDGAPAEFLAWSQLSDPALETPAARLFSLAGIEPWLVIWIV